MKVFITGANRGIGLGFVKYYLERGCDVWACYRSSQDELAEITSPKLHLLQWDVREDKSDDFIEQAGLPETIDLLINNAGIYGPNKADDQSLTAVLPETMHEVFDVNCVGALRVIQKLVLHVIKAKGVIANISSKMGSSDDNSSGGCYAYRAAKAALVIVSKSMAIDLACHGVRVISLHPGWVSTRMVDFSGLIDVYESVSGMTKVIADIDRYEPGSFVAYDGKIVPY